MGGNISNGITNFVSVNDSRTDYISSSESVRINGDSHSSDEIDEYYNDNNRLNQGSPINNSNQSNTPSKLLSKYKIINPKMKSYIEEKLDKTEQIFDITEQILDIDSKESQNIEKSNNEEKRSITFNPINQNQFVSNEQSNSLVLNPNSKNKSDQINPQNNCFCQGENYIHQEEDFENYRNKINIQSPRIPDNFQTEIDIQNNLKEETKHQKNQEFEERSDQPYPCRKKDISVERNLDKISRNFTNKFHNHSQASQRKDSQGNISKITEEDQSEGGSYNYIENESKSKSLNNIPSKSITDSFSNNSPHSNLVAK